MSADAETFNLEDELKPYQYYEQQIIYKIHHFYISQMFSEPAGYVDMVHRIRSAGPDDIVHIHLNTPGGQLGTGVQLINAMQSSQAHVVCSLEAESHSLGTLIFLAADEFIVHDNCMMMLHNFSSGTFGKGNEQAAQLDATIKWFNELAANLYVPFIDKEELDRILRGEDLWLHSGEIRQRLENMVEVLREQKEADEAAEAAEKEAAEKAPVNPSLKKRPAVKKKAAKKKAAPKK